MNYSTYTVTCVLFCSNNIMFLLFFSGAKGSWDLMDTFTTILTNIRCLYKPGLHANFATASAAKVKSLSDFFKVVFSRAINSRFHHRTWYVASTNMLTYDSCKLKKHARTQTKQKNSSEKKWWWNFSSTYNRNRKLVDSYVMVPPLVTLANFQSSTTYYNHINIIISYYINLNNYVYHIPLLVPLLLNVYTTYLIYAPCHDLLFSIPQQHDCWGTCLLQTLGLRAVWEPGGT